MTAQPDGVVVVTGATSGIGRATARRLAAGGTTVFAVGRDPARTDTACAEIGAGTDATVRGFVADLAAQRSVRALAEDLRAVLTTDGLRLDAIVHSAGVYTGRRTVTEDGLEQTMAVNHVAPFLLTHELVAPSSGPAPEPSPIVVVVGSHAHRAATLDPTDLAGSGRHIALRSYRRSKLANELFVRELAHRLAGPRSGAYTVDPGLVDTAIGAKHGGPLSRVVWRYRRRLGTAPEIPARTIAALATGSLGAGTSGTSWRDGRRIVPGVRALDDALARAVWEASCRICGIEYWAARSDAPARATP